MVRWRGYSASTTYHSYQTNINSSSILATEMYCPWKKRTEWAPRVHDNVSNPVQNNGQNIHGTAIHAIAQTSHDIPSEAFQYAPPLSAYSANYCGASLALTEYNRLLQMRALSGREDIPILSPHTMNRLDTLRKLKTAGYATLAPIGFHKTMKQMEVEKIVESDEAYIQAENLVVAGTSTTGEALSLHNVHEHSLNSPSAADEFNPPTNVLLQSMDRDLDRQIVDEDIDGPVDLDADLDEDGPDAFMAEDVEYQFDQSLGFGSNNGLMSTGDVSLTFSTIAGLSSAPNAIAPTASTSFATVPPRACDDSDVDMTLED